MVRSFAQRVAASLLLVTIFAAARPLAAAADQTATPAATHYVTAITTAYGSPYPIAGHLDIEVFADGTLRGYYHNAYQKAFIQVVGGKDANYICFDIGPPTTDIGLGNDFGGKVHVVATIDKDGSFSGQLYPLYASLDNNSFASHNAGINTPEANAALNGAPAPQPTVDDQYIFKAKPVDQSAEDYPYPFTTPH